MATAGLAYTKGRVVGKGTWGSVCLGTVSKTGRKVAIKEIHRSLERYEVRRMKGREGRER
jgi:serine/threonine protein kinase